MKSKNTARILWSGSLGFYKRGKFLSSCDIEAYSYQELLYFAKESAKELNDNNGVRYYLTDICKYTEKEEFAKKQRVKV